MASEIRVNKIANRAGLSTVEYTDTGIIVSGIITCTEISGLNALNIAGVSTFASPLDINGDIDVDGHTELDNVNITGVTSTAAINVGGILDVKSTFPQIRLTDTNHNDDFHILNEHGEFKIRDATNNVNRIIINSVGVTTFSSITNFNQGVNVIGDLDVDGHTNLDNVSIAGITTFSNAVNIANGTISRTSTGSNLIFQTDLETRLFHSSNNHVKLTFYGSGETLRGSIEAQATQIQIKDSGGRSGLVVAHGAESRLYFNDYQKFTTTNTGAIVTGVLTATSFSGDGSSLSNLPAGAPVGGASTNTVFFENDTAVAVNYQITSGKNAMSAGPLAINAGIAVTVPSGSSWTIV